MQRQGITIGRITGNGANAVQYLTNSDRRLKQNIQDMQGALELLAQIQPKTYEFKAVPGVRQLGFIAQELQPVLPQAVGGTPDGDVEQAPMAVDYGQLTPVLTGAVKELHELVKTQQARIAELEAQLQKAEAARAQAEQGQQNLLEGMEARLKELESRLNSGQANR
jgi:uncharacterized protein involved in exopolysaccharide biosynthesis